MYYMIKCVPFCMQGFITLLKILHTAISLGCWQVMLINLKGRLPRKHR